MPKRIKPWMRLALVAVIMGSVSTGCALEGDGAPAGSSTPAQSAPAEPTESEAPTEVAPLDLEAFLTEQGVAFESARLSARKAVIYVPTETTNEQAQQIAHDVMLYICGHAAEAGDPHPAANRVEVSDSVSIYSEGYDAAEHPSAFVTDEVCEG